MPLVSPCPTGFNRGCEAEQDITELEADSQLSQKGEQADEGRRPMRCSRRYRDGTGTGSGWR